MTQFEGQEYLNIEEASALLGRSRRTLERYTTEGRIKRYRRGLRIFYRRIDIERLAAELDRIVPDEPQQEDE